MRLLTTAIVVAAWLAVGAAAAGQRSGVARGGSGSRVTTAFSCAANLGAGIKSRRTFCDVLIASDRQSSVTMAIPPRIGDATLRFDLHNRFTVPAATDPAMAFLQHEALVTIVGADGAVIGRAAVARQFRSELDLFDQIGGGARPGGVKAVAPGPAEAVTIAIPAGTDTIGIVGASLSVLTRLGQETFDAPGRPVAIVSNLRIDYQPAR